MSKTREILTVVTVLISGLLLLVPTNMNAQKTVKLWEGNPPTDNKLTGNDVVERNGTWISNISVPEMYIYSPDKAKNNGMAVLICPGGGYAGVAISHEGHQIAQWLNTLGITGIVLKYRMPNKHKDVPLEDVHQAMRYIRSNASELGININKVGIAGSSAGGHLAATASNRYATSGISTRPDFSILFYPVITMGADTHGGSKNNLLGDNPSISELHQYSIEKQVNANTPPAILLLSDDDKTVLPINSTMYYNALKDNGIDATMYIFPEGGHGWGMGEGFKYHKQMTNLLEMWLKKIEGK
ncbi:MAG: alpha/beta hydrolase [Prevotella sp.]|jgi:acetyl esterase/lipase|nr:alpha/beta hydrolase [Prevotella sp.]